MSILKKRKSLSPAGIQTQDRQPHSIVTIPISYLQEEFSITMADMSDMLPTIYISRDKCFIATKGQGR
jgi:hypothetical protein